MGAHTLTHTVPIAEKPCQHRKFSRPLSFTLERGSLRALGDGVVGHSIEALSKIYRDTLSKLRLAECDAAWASEYARRIILKLGEIANRRELGSIKSSILTQHANAYSVLLEKTPLNETRVSYSGPCPLDFYVAGEHGLTSMLVEELFQDLTRYTREEEGEEYNLLLVATSWGERIVFGAVTPNKQIIGPMTSVLRALTAANVEGIGEGRTPYLPVWLHPVTAAVIPASTAQVEYARWIVYSLLRRGVNVVTLEPPGSLGKRIRLAASHWIPYIVSVEERDAATASVTVRRKHRVGEQEVLSVADLIDEITGLLFFHGVLGARLL